MKTLTSIPRICADRHRLKHAELSEKLIGIVFSIYNELGHVLQSVYEQGFSGLAEQGVFFQRQTPVFFERQKIGDFRTDRLVDSKILIELETGREVDPAWEKQLLNYLRATAIEVGLLFNFGPQAQFRRYVFENERENPRKSA
jgi:GxxExxY protein